MLCPTYYKEVPTSGSDLFESKVCSRVLRPIAGREDFDRYPLPYCCLLDSSESGSDLNASNCDQNF